MKLVEADVPDKPTGEAPSPRPPRRKVAVSLVFTISVLVATVVIVYVSVPKRHHELLAVAIEQHAEPGELQLNEPTRSDLIAWSVGVYGKPVPWPLFDSSVELIGASTLQIFRRPASFVRMRIGDTAVTLMAVAARDVPPRRRRLSEGDFLAISWRAGKWTFVAVGPKDSAARWQPMASRWDRPGG